MNVLGIDTSGREGSVALAQGGVDGFDVLGFIPLVGNMFSAQLIPQIAALLQRAGIGKSAIDVLAVASGPGSFTGLRVGLSTVKGLAEALHIPIVAVSVLEAVAVAGGRSGRVLAALDAQRKEAYVGEYEIAQGEAPANLRIRAVNESLVPLIDFTTWLSARVPVPTTYTPDAMLERAVLQAGSPAEKILRPAADLVARVGLAKYLQGITVSPEALDANYIRRDAEIFSTPAPGVPSR